MQNKSILISFHRPLSAPLYYGTGIYPIQLHVFPCFMRWNYRIYRTVVKGHNNVPVKALSVKIPQNTARRNRFSDHSQGLCMPLPESTEQSGICRCGHNNQAY